MNPVVEKTTRIHGVAVAIMVVVVVKVVLSKVLQTLMRHFKSCKNV